MKKILFTFLTVLLASLAAQAATDYGFEVAGVTVTSANCNNAEWCITYQVATPCTWTMSPSS